VRAITQRGLAYIWRHPLASRNRPAATLRYLRWQLASRLRPEPIVMPWVQGARLVVRRGLAGATGNLYCGLHEWPDMPLVLHLLRPGDLFLDLGSNVGSYTVLAGAVAGADVIAVEPVPATLAVLRDNIALNGLADRVEVLPVALGANLGEVLFSLDRDATNQVVTAAYGGTSAVVPSLPLDAVRGAERACCAKIDVEGQEPALLAGGRRVLASPALQVVLLEGRQPEVMAAMQEHGFVPCTYHPWERRLEEGVLTQGGNQIWVRDPAWACRRLAEASALQVLDQRL
jgi:FkbM family methyltransferase